MQNYKVVEEEIAFTKTVQQLVQSYEEIAIMRMQRIRDSVEKTRVFVEDVSPIFAEVKHIYKYQKVKELKKSERDHIDKMVFSTLKKNGKTVNVLLTPNDRLVGNIGQKVYMQFIQEILSTAADTDIVVVGRLGRKLLSQGHADLKYKYFDMPEVKDGKAVSAITEYIINYENIEVYYGKFNNLVNQESFHENLSGNKGEDIINVDEKLELDYLFEPSVEGVMNFFEKEVFNSMFKQKISESELAKLGSRINAMEAATTNTKKNKERLEKLRVSIMHRMDNQKQLERLSGISLWD